MCWFCCSVCEEVRNEGGMCLYGNNGGFWFLGELQWKVFVSNKKETKLFELKGESEK